MKTRLILCAAATLSTATSSVAGLRDDRNRALHLNLYLAEAVCAKSFGFTALHPLSKEGATRTEVEMVPKIDAYWLLRGGHDVTENMDLGADPAWAGWYHRIANPIVAVQRKDANLPGEREAAAAAVAAAKDPSIHDEARARYMSQVMRPWNDALAACAAGSRDEFIGTHYWTGQGSAVRVEKEMGDYFDQLVADLKNKP